MAEVEIRPAVSSDISALEKFDHTSETTHVWRVDSSVTRDRIAAELNEVKLPRVLRLSYPRRAESLKDTWTRHLLFLVARCEGNLVGYLTLDEDSDKQSAMVCDLVVNAPMRRQGIATALIFAAQDWVKRRGMTRLVLEMPAKNHAMIELARKLRFGYAGMVDNYYMNGDMALFYMSTLK
ncbi:MAG TPA: GNAT family N-acetyltransferase [Anaerolineaceae bacterium]|nr:GNAT family N-acetyltransferase [Anaerolineaceae bacterium]